MIEEMKLKVVYTLPSGSSDDSGVTSSANRSFKQGGDDLSMLKNASIEEIQTIQRLKDERDNNLQQNQQMQRELVLYIDIFTLHVVSTHCFSSVQILV